MRTFIQSLPHPLANALLMVRRMGSNVFADGLLTVASADFRKDAAFIRAYAAAKATGSFSNWDVRWRIHVLTWFAGIAARVEGDFVECGTDHGGTARAVLELVDLGDRTFWLLDTFRGIDGVQLTDEERGTAGYFDYEDCYERVSKTFADFKNVRLVRGSVPSTLPQVTATAISLLHLDMNATVPEIAALEHFWPLMPSGAVTVLDDYGWPRHREQKAGFDRFAVEQSTAILQLPTGQGVIVK